MIPRTLPGRRLRTPPSRLVRTLAVAVAVVVALGCPAGAVDGRQPVGRWPLDPVPEVVALFDPPDTPYGPGHRGVDLLGRGGQPVSAALPGRVTFAAVLAGRGVVVVDHGATRTTYEPVVADVAVGRRVAAGEVLGTLETTGSHCFPRACLHWGWRRDDTYLDPLLLVGGGPVRLLPWDGDPVVPPAVGAAAPTLRPPPLGWWPAPVVVAAVRLAGAPARRPGAGGRS